MRTIINKKNFTHSERIIIRVLQENHIPFKTKVKIGGKEIDFLIGRYVIEIDGHEQSTGKNNFLVSLGYVPIHLSNKEITINRSKVSEILNQLNVN